MGAGCIATSAAPGLGLGSGARSPYLARRGQEVPYEVCVLPCGKNRSAFNPASPFICSSVTVCVAGGAAAKDVELRVTGGMLHIQVERHEEEKVEEEHYVPKEIHRGSVDRTLALTEEFTERDVKATYTDRSLEIVIPKAEIELFKKIAVTKS